MNVRVRGSRATDSYLVSPRLILSARVKQFKNVNRCVHVGEMLSLDNRYAPI